MSQLRPCKVIISGGGLAGLTLALTLEKLGVDYQLLEAYPNIVPTVGSGICILANALTILDQLGCYEALAARGTVVKTIDLRAPNGDSLVSTGKWETTCPERYGYQFHWMERSAIVQVLYQHIADKSKILTGKRVGSIVNSENGVEVTTTDGSVYHGDLIVGADGVHSGVRREIQRQAAERNLGPEYTDQKDVPATYGCIYGMSPILPGVPKGCLDFTANRHSSSILGTGPNDRTFWFLYKNLGQTYRGADIPKFTQEDAFKLAQEHWDDCIMPGVRISDLYKSKKNVIYSAMPEYVFSKWHLDRMLILGDAAHQMTSILAQGGGQAMESVACLANILLPALSDKSKTGKLSTEEISNIFERVQEIRLPRVQTHMASSHQRQMMDSMETPELEDLMLNTFPKMVPDIFIDRWDESFDDAVCLGMFPTPERLLEARRKRAVELHKL